MGGPEFLGVVKGGYIFFQWIKGGGPEGGTRIFPQDGDLNFSQGEDQIFLRRPRGDQNFFAHVEGGRPEFFCASQGGGSEKIGEP